MSRVATYRLTIRHGPKVARERFDDLDRAMDAMEGRVREIHSEGPLREINALRDYEPGERVKARLQLSTGGVLGGREVGIDVMGDGALVPYAGVLRRRRLSAGDGGTAFDAVREALR